MFSTFKLNYDFFSEFTYKEINWIMDYKELKMSQNFSICVSKSFAQNNPNNGTKQHFKVHYDN